MNKIVIIGAGLGGLAIAVRLQGLGFEVTLLEKNAAVGGHASRLKEAGFTFDMGPSLITAPDIIQKVFHAGGARMEDHLELTKLDPFYRICYHDGTYLDYTDDTDRMIAQMRQFNPEDAAHYEDFIRESRELYHAVITDGLGSRPFMDWGTMMQFLPRALRLKALLPTHTFVKRHFKDPRHQFAYSFHPLFIGGNPFRAPAVYLMIPYLEKIGGVWYSRGGMYSLVRALESVFTSLGGRVFTGTPAREIVVRDGMAAGVQADGKFFEADAVISNADFAHTYRDLIPPGHRQKWTDRRVENLDYSMSAFLLYVGVNKQYPQLRHHTIVLSRRYRELVREIFDQKILPEDFSLYLHVPTRTDPGMAPPDSDSMMILAPVPNAHSGIDWEDRGAEYAQKILHYLEKDFGLRGLTEHTEVLQRFTPEDFRRQRNSYLGSAWGVEPKLTQTAIFRPHNRSEDIDRLYFVGASTHPGAGVPGVLLTAEATEQVVLTDFNMQHYHSKRA
ncbi:MAG TPA: phytoene desaturase family protein [bacterium]|nr:phytoene desaturase family protein [bacterium]